jgi:ATP-dependent helicase HepA
VRWLRGPIAADVGVVVETSPDGRRAKVLLDSGDELTFVTPTDALDRVEFADGKHVVVRNDGHTGVVIGKLEAEGQLIYRLSFGDGSIKSVPEASIRLARLTDPVALFRQGDIDGAFLMNLRIAATRLEFAHQFDELSSLSNSRVEIKPHQVGVLYRVASGYPHRFLLADEVGLGKTIEAGLILKELKARGVATRVLILAPSGIVSQWQFELKTKFNEVFAHYNRDTINYLEANNPGENVWTLHDNAIASTAFAAYDERRRAEITLAGWDFVVIDEAHHARRQWEGQSRYRDTNLYRLAAQLADPEQSATSGFLLLTATPMQLHRFELYSLIELLDPTLFSDFDDFDDHADSLAGLNRTVNDVQRWPALDEAEHGATARAVADWLSTDVSKATLDDPSSREGVVEDLLRRHRLSEVLIRNRKSVVGGFMSRQARVWPVPLTPQEREAYDAATEYVRSGYARSQALQNNALGFLMATFQKMNSSSSYTLGRSLVRRIERLELGLVESAASQPEDDELDEMPTADALGDLVALDSHLAVLEEIGELRRLVGLLDAIDVDSKAQILLNGLLDLRGEDPSIKVLVFTQFRDTQDYLLRLLAPDWQVGIFHGQLKPGQKDEAVGRFRDEPGPQVLISTEAGGEGRNFQFCHTMVNYDLPWNPMKVEQRIGRLDRIGQKHSVQVINLAVEGTIEERVLDVLQHRIRIFEDTIGGLDPILGTVETDLRRLFLAGTGDHAATLAAYEVDLETRVFQARTAEVRLADLIMDTKSFRQDEVRRILERKSPLETGALERFVLKALRQLGVQILADDQVPGVYDLRLRGHFLNEFPQFAREGITRRVTFDPSVALDFETIDFLAFGHELVDALVARCRSREFGGVTGNRIIVASEQPETSGWFFTYVLEFDGVIRSKEVFPVYVSGSGETNHGLATWLLERSSLLEREDPSPGEMTSTPTLTDAVVDVADREAVRRLLERQAELAALNRARLEQERAKLTRYFDYRHRAAEAKLESVQRTFERLSASDDPDVQRILPVWAKNLETARRVAEAVASDRERRLGELVGRDQVSAQHQMMTSSFVTIAPGP